MSEHQNDIVRRLRDASQVYENDHHSLDWEAADEIERLRAEVQSGVEDSDGWRQRCIAQDEEIERLSGLVAATADYLPGRYVVLRDDDSIIATDSPGDGDHIIEDRGEQR